MLKDVMAGAGRRGPIPDMNRSDSNGMPCVGGLQLSPERRNPLLLHLMYGEVRTKDWNEERKWGSSQFAVKPWHKETFLLDSLEGCHRESVRCWCPLVVVQETIGIALGSLHF